MEDSDTPQRHGQLREEAAKWFVIMRGPEAEIHRNEFEAWLARGAVHRLAYNRIAETFSNARFLKEDGEAGLEKERPQEHSQKPQRKANRSIGIVCATVSIIALGGAVLYLSISSMRARNTERPQSIVSASPSVGHPVQLATAFGEIRTFRLADGSKVTLDTDSVLLVAFGKAKRDLRLVRGRARFDVFHETRPFVVSAGNGRVTARGTIFDVSVGEDHRVTVRLMRGAVDIDRLEPTVTEKGVALRLSPGQQYSFKDGGQPQVSEKPDPDVVDRQWPDGLREYENVRLDDLLAEANRYSVVPLLTASPDLGEIRVSGTYRITDPRRLAENLADLLGLALVTTSNSLFLAVSCTGYEEKSCRPPS
jgi:transmembrane sensor